MGKLGFVGFAVVVGVLYVAVGSVKCDSLDAAHPSPELSYYTPFRERQVVLAELSLPLNLVTIPPPVVPLVYTNQYFFHHPHPGWRRKKRSLFYHYYAPVAIQHPPIITPRNFTNQAVISTETTILKENIRDFANYSKVVTDELLNDDKSLDFVGDGNTLAYYLQTWTKTNSNGTIEKSKKWRLRFPDAEGKFQEIWGPEDSTRFDEKELPEEIEASLQLLDKTTKGLHEKAEANGIRKDNEMRKKSDSLKRPRFHDTTQVLEDPLKEKDAEARKVSWILTNTVAIQTFPKIPNSVKVTLPVPLLSTVNLLKKR